MEKEIVRRGAWRWIFLGRLARSAGLTFALDPGHSSRRLSGRRRFRGDWFARHREALFERFQNIYYGSGGGRWRHGCGDLRLRIFFAIAAFASSNSFAPTA